MREIKGKINSVEKRKRAELMSKSALHCFATTCLKQLRGGRRSQRMEKVVI